MISLSPPPAACAGALSALSLFLSLSRRFLFVVVESIREERFRIASPSGAVMMDGESSLCIKYVHAQQTPLYYSLLLLPRAWQWDQQDPDGVQIGMLGVWGMIRRFLLTFILNFSTCFTNGFR